MAGMTSTCIAAQSMSTSSSAVPQHPAKETSYTVIIAVVIACKPRYDISSIQFLILGKLLVIYLTSSATFIERILFASSGCVIAVFISCKPRYDISSIQFLTLGKLLVIYLTSSTTYIERILFASSGCIISRLLRRL